MAAVAGGHTPPATVADARAALVIGLAAALSMPEGRSVRIAEIDAP